MEVEKIKLCRDCELCKNQLPLLDDVKKSQVFWIGLSAKISTTSNAKPLATDTISGGLLHEVEKKCKNISTYKTNLVKCVPLDECGKIRYPSKTEISSCIKHISLEIETLSPKIIFMLGNHVIDSMSKHYATKFTKPKNFDYHVYIHQNTSYIPIHHPSYIYVYKRKIMNDYIDALAKLIHQLAE